MLKKYIAELLINQIIRQTLYSFINKQHQQSKHNKSKNEEKMQPKNPKQKITISLKPKKSQICRFYLRGLCILKSHDCYFSHGVWDLFYKPWTEDEKIIYDYSKLEKDSKQPVFKGERIYINLYQYQQQKIFTLQQLNQDREKKNLIRNQMHAEMFNDFMDLLRCYYPDALFTQQFLLREFTRVGFNKTMSLIKLTHICAFVCDPPNSRYFKINLHIPPLTSKTTSYILPCATDQQNLSFYKNAYAQFIQNKKQQQLNENIIKKYLFSIVRPKLNLLPLNLYLKNKKMNFSNFIKLITNDTSSLTMVQMDTNTILAAIKKYVQQRIEAQNYCNWSQVYKYLSTQYQLNNANKTNPLRHILIDQGYIFFYFPMMQLITTPKQLNIWEFNSNNGCRSVCECKYKDMYPQEQLLLNLINFNNELAIKQSFDIYDMQSLLKCAGTILNSNILAVDIQGRLRKNGYIQMIQINTGLNTFLIDIHRILLNADMETFELCKKILRNMFCNPKIVKIFHDSRHDSLVLHEIINTCVVNVFDTSAIQTLIGQLNLYKNTPSKQIFKKIVNVQTPGLNELLKKYNAPHGINKNKQWFHQLWRKGHTELFEQRPLHPQYRQYCIKDVLDLPYLRDKMSTNLSEQFCDFISSHYVRAGYLYTTEGA